MKKIIAVILCYLLLCFLVGCGLELEDSSSVFSEIESTDSVKDFSSKDNVSSSPIISSNITSSSDKAESDIISSEIISSSSKAEITNQNSEQKEMVTNTEPKEENVYVTPTGKRYHLDPDCGGKNSTLSTISAAKRRGLTPCKKCAQ